MAKTHDIAIPVAADIDRVNSVLQGGDAGQVLRQEALARLSAMPEPDRVTHLWRFTNPANLVPESSFHVSSKPVGPTADESSAAVVDLVVGNAPLITMNQAGRDAGLQIMPLAEAGDLIKRMDEVSPAHESSWFADWNATAWNAGVVVRVPSGQAVSAPIRVIIHAEGEAVLPRVLLVAEPTSEVVLVEEHRGGQEGTRVAGVTKILADSGAHVRHVLVQAWADGVNGYLSAQTRAARDADVLSVFCALGGERTKLELVTTLAGAGSRSNMVGVVLGADRQHLDVHTRHVHEAGHTRSDIDVKTVVTGRARSSYTGLIRIDKTAREVEAFQENRNLVLSDTARADSIPELEILNQDVSCSHGATVAPLDEQQVFYLESRGIATPQARLMIVRGFLETTLTRLPESLRESVAEIVDERLKAVEETME